MSATAALDVEGVDGPAVQHAEGVLDGEALVEAVAVQGDLDVVFVGDPQGGVQGPGVGPHVLVDLETAGPAFGQRLHQGGGIGGRTPGQEADVDRPGVEGVEGVLQRPGRVDADTPGGPDLLADDRRDTGGEGRLHDPRREQVYVGVDGARGGDQPLPRDDRRAGADDDVHPVERVRVPGAADRVDAALPDADGHLADALDRVDDQDVADHHVTGLRHRGGLEVQAVTRGLPETGEELVAGPLAVGLDAHDEPGVAEPDPVTRAGAVHGGVLLGVDVPAGGRAVVAVAGGSAHRVAPEGPCASAAPR